MRISEALGGIQRLYVETAPFIYYIEENPRYIARMDQVIRLIMQNAIEGFCSVITLTEVLPVPLKAGNSKLVQAYRDILLNSREFQCVSVDQATASNAAELRAQYNLKTPDALHIASALRMNCDAFLTNDSGMKRVTNLTVHILDELEIDATTDEVIEDGT